MKLFSATAPSSDSPIYSNTKPMRKLLRHKCTRAFLTKDGAWAQDIHEALILSEPATPGAVSGVQTGDLEIYYSFDDAHESQYDFAVSIR
jgi:hypothetical protein